MSLALANASPGDTIEFSPVANALAYSIASRITEHKGGKASWAAAVTSTRRQVLWWVPSPLPPSLSFPGAAALMIDYGEDHAFSNSLRGIQHHTYVDILQEPGAVDIVSLFPLVPPCDAVLTPAVLRWCCAAAERIC